jgi:hypothetical protein
VSDLVSDLDALLTQPLLPPGKTCHVGYLLDSLEADEADMLRRVLDESQVPATRITVILRQYGVTISHKTISRHRRRKEGLGCVCP